MEGKEGGGGSGERVEGGGRGRDAMRDGDNSETVMYTHLLVALDSYQVVLGAPNSDVLPTKVPN